MNNVGTGKCSTPAPGNSLGLDIQNLTIEDDGTIPAPESSEQPVDFPKDGPTDTAKKAEKKPYVNADRHMTGSNPRVNIVPTLPTEQIYNGWQEPSDDELAARMARIRENNEKIKQRQSVCGTPALILDPTDVGGPAGRAIGRRCVQKGRRRKGYAGPGA